MEFTTPFFGTMVGCYISTPACIINQILIKTKWPEMEYSAMLPSHGPVLYTYIGGWARLSLALAALPVVSPMCHVHMCTVSIAGSYVLFRRLDRIEHRLIIVQKKLLAQSTQYFFAVTTIFLQLHETENKKKLFKILIFRI